MFIFARIQEAETLQQHKHILRPGYGITIKGVLDEDAGQFRCTWTPSPPFRKKVIKRIGPIYEEWRNRIVTDWVQRTGKRVLLVTVHLDGPPGLTSIGGD